jgi:hypothetical protein
MNLSKKYSKFQNTLKTLKNETLILTLIVALKTKFNFPGNYYRVSELKVVLEEVVYFKVLTNIL